MLYFKIFFFLNYAYYTDCTDVHNYFKILYFRLNTIWASHYTIT